MVLTAGRWGRQYQDSYWISSALLILAYMTDSNWKHHTPEVGAKSTVRLKKDHLLIKLNCTHWRQWAIERMKRRGAREEKKKKVRIKRKTSHCTPSVILPDKRTNYISASWHPRVKIGIGSLSALFVWEHVDIGSISSHKRAREVHRPTFQPFILASFVFRYTHVCVCCLSPLLGGIDCYYSKQHYLY